MKRGTIVLAKFPFTDLKGFKRRPAIIVSNDNRSNTDLLLDPGKKDFKKSGLLKPSVIKSDKLATLNKSIFTGELGSVSPETLREIDKRLKIALAL